MNLFLSSLFRFSSYSSCPSPVGSNAVPCGWGSPWSSPDWAPSSSWFPISCLTETTAWLIKMAKSGSILNRRTCVSWTEKPRLIVAATEVVGINPLVYFWLQSTTDGFVMLLRSSDKIFVDLTSIPYPTGHFTILNPPNPSLELSEPHKEIVNRRILRLRNAK